jgi:signal transduction histidine kinase
VLVELYADDCDLTLRVVDNGIGFEVAGVRFGSGLGLISMRERLNLVAGCFEINSGEGRGTIVTATVPIPVEACQTT